MPSLRAALALACALAAPAAAGYGRRRAPGYDPVTGLTSPQVEWAPPPPVAFVRGRIVNAETGAGVRMQGFNWAGFNYGMGFVEGVGEPGAPALAADFAVAVYRQALLGFNLVRLPFRFEGLDGPPRTRLAGRCKAATRGAVRAALSSNPYPPYADIDTDAIPLPPPVAPPARPRRGDPACNWYLPDGPGTTVLDRLLFAAQYYVANGFYVILDWHPTDAPEAWARADSATVADVEGFARKWGALASALASLPAWKAGHLPGRVMFELINEPDRLGMAWNVPTVGWLNETALDAAIESGQVGAGAAEEEEAALEAGGGPPSAEPGSPTPSGRRRHRRRRLAQWAPVAEGLQSGADPRLRGGRGGGGGGEEGEEDPAIGAAIAAGTFNITQRPLADLYLAAAAAVMAATPVGSGGRGGRGGRSGGAAAADAASDSGALFILEGTNQSYWTPPMAWGAAFITDPAVAADHAARGRPYSDAAPFFEALAGAPGGLAARVALGPHVYGPSLGWDPAQQRGETLWRTHSKAFGYGSRFGATFPVILTEFGSHLDTADDVAWLADLARWANCRAPAPGCGPGGDHSPVAAWAWWQWSPTAWDTGGLVEDDWVTPAWDKINNLTSLSVTAEANGGGWWLRPWYLGPKKSGARNASSSSSSSSVPTAAAAAAAAATAAASPVAGPAPVRR